jgi:tetratricopeptide (TPR) repeat protein
LAELEYQRGYLANEREANDEANTYLNRALEDGRRLNSPQLEIRARTQLASVAYNSGKLDEAIRQANAAIELARDNKLPAWAADGLVRLASTELLQHNLGSAEGHVNEAFQILLGAEQDRVEAMANLTLASLRNPRHSVASHLVFGRQVRLVQRSCCLLLHFAV